MDWDNLTEGDCELLDRCDPDLRRRLKRAGKNAGEPDLSLVDLRIFCERLLKQIAAHHNISLQAGGDGLDTTNKELINRLRDGGFIPWLQANDFHFIRMAGNKAAHGEVVSHQTMADAIAKAQRLAGWFVKNVLKPVAHHTRSTSSNSDMNGRGSSSRSKAASAASAGRYAYTEHPAASRASPSVDAVRERGRASNSNSGARVAGAVVLLFVFALGWLFSGPQQRNTQGSSAAPKVAASPAPSENGHEVARPPGVTDWSIPGVMLSRGERYDKVREKLLAAGWEPLNTAPVGYCGWDADMCPKVPELLSCVGVGTLAPCYYAWKKGDAYVEVEGAGEGSPQGFDQMKHCRDIRRSDTRYPLDWTCVQ